MSYNLSVNHYNNNEYKGIKRKYQMPGEPATQDISYNPFLISEIIIKVLAYSDIADIKTMSTLNHEWKNVSDYKLLWQIVGNALQIPRLQNKKDIELKKEDIKIYFLNMKLMARNTIYTTFYSSKQGDQLLKSLELLCAKEQIQNINHLSLIPKAQDQLCLWEVLQELVYNEVDFENFELKNFDSLEKILSISDEFRIWCEKHKEDLLKITNLDLSERNLTSLPTEIKYLGNLKQLVIENNQLITLPAEIGNLQFLEVLNADFNKLTELPATIGNLERLQMLSASNNCLTALPDEIQNLGQLVVLEVDKNKLTELPVNMEKLENLQSLSVGHNQLASLPACIGHLSNLSDITINCNKLTTLPAEIGDLNKLKVLDFSDNLLVMLPDQIEKLNNLETLLVCRNQLSALPAAIGKMIKLKVLDFSDNLL